MKPQVAEAMSRAECLDDMPWGSSDAAAKIRFQVENYSAAKDGYTLRPYQEAGCVNLMVRKNCLLADEMGVGKTPEAICAAELLGLDNVLIITPKSVALGWQDEIDTWCGRPSQVWLTKKKNQSAGGWVVLPWSQITQRQPELMLRRWDVIIFDESHFAKNSETKRTIAAFGTWRKKRGDWEHIRGLIHQTERKWCLTGTPIKNKPIDLYPALRALNAGDFAKSKNTFGERYCKKFNAFTPLGYDFTGAENTEELNEKLRQSVMVRRLKKDVMKDMPPLQRQVIPLIANADVKRVLKKEHKLISMEQREMLKEALGNGYVPPFEECSEMRKEMGVAKIPLVVDYVTEQVGIDDEPLIVCAYHRDVIEGIAQGLVDKGIAAHYIHGGHSAIQRDGIVKRFQAGEIKVLVVSIPACGTGMNGLQHGCQRGIVAELDWAQSAMWQMEGRLHRYGQLGSVLFTYLMVPDSLDPYMLDTILAKDSIEKEILK